MSKLKVLGAAVVMFLSAAVSADHFSEKSIDERTKPSGKVYQEGDDVPVSKPAVAAVESSSGARSAEEIYNASCAMCHSSDAMGAPVVGNAESWVDRLTKGEQAIIDNAIKGINGMPPMGTCGTCSNDDIAATVKYMLEKSK